MRFVSYAQDYEDVILRRAPRDIGTSDPEEYWVTCAFYERGWSGIYAEPLVDHFEKLTKATPRDTNLKVTAGRGRCLPTLHTLSSTGTSTFDLKVTAQHQSGVWERSETIVPVLTLRKVPEDCGYNFAFFDGLNCLHVADKTQGLKEQSSVPPNMFDEFVPWPEWSKAQKVAGLEQELVGSQTTRQARRSSGSRGGTDC
jgi:hypothetical protein